jgi:hypothetical protein
MGFFSPEVVDMRILLVPVVLALGLSGCSGLVTRGPPPDYRSLSEFQCTESYVFPVLDGVAAAGTVGLVAHAWATDHEYKVFSTLAGGLIGLWAAMSAGAGYDKVRSCREAQAEMREELQRQLGPLGGPDDEVLVIWPGTPHDMLETAEVRAQTPRYPLLPSR